MRVAKAVIHAFSNLIPLPRPHHMANMTPSRPGQIAEAGDVRALFLKLAVPGVLEQFLKQTIFRNLTSLRTITSGKSAQHIVSGLGTGAYHTPGTQLVGTLVPWNERVIAVDDEFVADRFIAKVDELLAHYEIRSVHFREMGHALAMNFDSNVAQTIVLASRAAATVSGGDSGAAVTSATIATSADTLVAALFSAAQNFDEKNIPKGDRYAAVTPAMYYLLVNSAKMVNRDYTAGANGGVDSGEILRVAGIKILASNNIPSTNVVSGPSTYQGDFSKTKGLVWTPEAAGTTQVTDISVSTDYEPMYRGDLMTAAYLAGHGILRPECAVELATP